MHSLFLIIRFVYYEKYRKTNLLQNLAGFLSFSCILLLYFSKYHANIAFTVTKPLMFQSLIVFPSK